MAKILVVDDRAINREFLAMLLGYAGHDICEAADGAAGLATAHRSGRKEVGEERSGACTQR